MRPTLEIALGAARRLRHRPLLAIGASVAWVSAAVLVRMALEPLLQNAPFLTIFPAIVLATLGGGVLGGIVATVLGSVAAWYLFIPPWAAFVFDWQSAASVGAFFIVALLIVGLVVALNEAMDAIDRKNTALEALFAELQHRVANNLAFVAALLRLQRRADHPDAAEALDRASARIAVIGQIHRSLYSPQMLDQAPAEHLTRLCRDILAAGNRPNVTLDVRSDAVALDLKIMVALSLILNELVTNAIKHALPEDGGGEVRLELLRSGKAMVFAFSDCGPGYPSGFDPRASQRLGFLVVQNLAASLGGSVRFQPGPGARTEVEFPLEQSR